MIFQKPSQPGGFSAPRTAACSREAVDTAAPQARPYPAGPADVEIGDQMGILWGLYNYIVDC